MLDLAKDTKPSEIKIIKTTKGAETLFVVITYKFASTGSEKIKLVEMHPLQRVRTIVGRNYAEKLKTTPYGNCTTNRFFLILNDVSKTASFGPRHCISLDNEYRSFGLASYMFSQLIAWGKQIAPSYKVVIGHLSLFDAQQEGNKERRNRFYANFGFVLDPPEADEGTLYVESIGVLNEHYDTQKIQVLSKQVDATNQYPFFDHDAVSAMLPT